MKAREITLISVFAALTAVCAWISIPAPVSFTLQTFGVFFALYLLGGKRGFLSVLVYVLLGCVGLPVFSAFRGGLGVLLGPSGGFIIGFLAAALVMWALENRISKLWCSISALSAVYVLGCLWYGLYSGESLSVVFTVCVLPHVLPDILKLWLANIAAKRLDKQVKM